ncbi:MAG TPA: deoxyribodipyrimidine photo-lyase [Dermatophilaceae bacterium]|nr:deoxyribodipyrimidine photo-lyase [Dermatophilaceae bacterium]
MPTTLLWFRRDLRLADLPALAAAHDAAGDGQILPVFVVDPVLWSGSGAVRTHCLVEALEGVRRATDGALVIRTGPAATVIPQLAREVGASSIHVSGETTPYGRRRDEAVRTALSGTPGPAGAGARDQVDLVATGTPYAVGPGRLHTQEGRPFRVFTPFSRAWREHGWPAPAEVPTGVRWLTGVAGEDLPAAPEGAGAGSVPVTEAGARRRWSAFLAAGLDHYDSTRDRPDLDGTSLMSVHLKFGTIHPRTLLADIARHPGAGSAAAIRFVTELCWREFYADVLWHNPGSAWADLRDGLAGLRYRDPATDSACAADLEAWRQGRTGYPLVDAGMRQLRTEGWMHNRVRMVTASFLTKDLHVWWPVGARHFLALLRDGDVASNNHGWQWTAGTGTDAAPYFRVFNPVTQGSRFDPQGDYVRRYIPELRHLPGSAAHEPWTHPEGYRHGYPPRIVDHAQERRDALARYEQARAAGTA